MTNKTNNRKGLAVALMFAFTMMYIFSAGFSFSVASGAAGPLVAPILLQAGGTVPGFSVTLNSGGVISAPLPGYIDIKIESGNTASLGSIAVNVTISGGDISFSSNTPVTFVYVKASTEGNWYNYSGLGGVLSDQNLTSGRDSISHVVFYFAMVQPTPEPPTPTPEPPTPTPEPPTPTPEPPTPTPEPPTPTPEPPTPTPEPPTPTPEPPTPTPSPEVIIEDEEIPGGPIDPTPTPEATLSPTPMPDEIDLDDPQVPGGGLPQTGEIPPAVFYSLGALITGVGLALKKKKE